MAELADAIDLGSIVNRRAGSSPVNRRLWCGFERKGSGFAPFLCAFSYFDM